MLTISLRRTCGTSQKQSKYQYNNFFTPFIYKTIHFQQYDCDDFTAFCYFSASINFISVTTIHMYISLIVYLLFRVEGEAEAGKEKLVLSQECHLVTLMNAVKGRFDITTTHVYFHDLSPIKEDLDRQDFKV